MLFNSRIFNSAIIWEIENIKKYEYCKNCKVYHSCDSVYVWTKDITVWNNGRQSKEKTVFSACYSCIIDINKKQNDFLNKNNLFDIEYYVKRLFL